MNELIERNSLPNQSKNFDQSIHIRGARKTPHVLLPPNEETGRSLIWRALKSGLQSSAFDNLAPATQGGRILAAKTFVNWLGQTPHRVTNSVAILDHFSRFEVRELGHRTNDCTVKVRSIILHAKAALDGTLDNQQRRALEDIVNRTRRITSNGSAASLSDWFLGIDWLRIEMEKRGKEHLYLKLESPRMLAHSFSVFCATLLEEISNFRTACLNICEPSHTEIKTDSNILLWGANGRQVRELQRCQLEWFSPVIRSMHDRPCSEEFFFSTRYGDMAEVALADFHQQPGKALKMRLTHECREYAVQSPYIFSRYHLFIPSRLEQLVVMQQIALAAVQPSMAGQLKLSNMVVQKNSRGRPLSLQFRYRKPRSRGFVHETANISARTLVGRSMLRYLDLITSAQEHLDENDRGLLTPHYRAGSEQKLSNPTRGTPYSVPNLLIYWTRQPAMRQRLLSAYRDEKASSAFYECFLALMTACDYSYVQGRNRNTSDGVSSRVLPNSAWTNQSLKQLGVFARSDQYRVGDLRNTNSHSAETERMHYLTDKNKDWVNRNGRVTRLVINDLERYVYCPNVDRVHETAYERGLRTEVVTALDTRFTENDVLINSIRPESLEASGLTTTSDFNQIVVLDHPATVVYLLHYLAQAKDNSQQLALNAPDFFEQTVAPRCEWMERLLSEKLSPTSVKAGSAAYQRVESSLPPLFTHKWRGS